MDRKKFNQYLERFNARDYEGFLTFYTPQFEISFVGYALRSREAVVGFYTYFHRYVRETVLVDAFVSNETIIAMEARIRLEGVRELTPEALRTAGFGRLKVPKVGEVLEIPQFIHYHLRAGKFTEARCAVYEPADEGRQLDLA